MAEVAIPMAALGLMYILSNQKEPEPVLEGFEETTLPNIKRPPVNYPVENLKELKNNVSKYNGKKTGVENFYKGDNYSEARQRSKNKITSCRCPNLPCSFIYSFNSCDLRSFKFCFATSSRTICKLKC